MADNYDRAKRLKSSGDAEVVAELRGRIAELESAVRNKEVALRGRIAELESENEQLHRRGRREEGSHEVLPVVVEVFVTTAVDLSRVNTSIVTLISSFLDKGRAVWGFWPKLGP
ncbi:hypothetical protein THAOC_24156, partial [Thalassiosira oceanica]